MPRKSDKPRKNPFNPDYRPYGTYVGEKGNPRQWKAAYEERMGPTEAQETLQADPESPYAILGLAEGVTDFDLIKRAFRKAVFATHPDYGGTDKAFTRVRAAYSILAGKYG